MTDSWTFDPAVALDVAILAALFGQAFVRLRRRGRGDRASWWRLVLFTGALAAFGLPLVSPVDAAADGYLLSAHMLEHVLLGDVAPALAVVALRGPLLVFLLPAAALRRLARLDWLRAAAAFLLRPPVSFAVWAGGLAAWHLPAAYDAALAHASVHELEHLTFVVGGTLVWCQLVDPLRRRALGYGARLVYLGAVFATSAALSAVLLASPRPLYPAYAAQPDRLLALSPLDDQRLAGLTMLAEQLLSLGLCLAFLRRPAERPAEALAVAETA